MGLHLLEQTGANNLLEQTGANHLPLVSTLSRENIAQRSCQQ
jgi:hypothetical protein